MDCSSPGSSVIGILRTRIVEWVAIPFSRGSSQPRDQTWVSCVAGGCFTVWATREATVSSSLSSSVLSAPWADRTTLDKKGTSVFTRALSRPSPSRCLKWVVSHLVLRLRICPMPGVFLKTEKPLRMTHTRNSSCFEKAVHASGRMGGWKLSQGRTTEGLLQMGTTRKERG